MYRQWLNVKEPFCSLTKKNPMGMAGMLRTLKLELTGRHHSGIDDCRNIMKIVLCLLERNINLLPSSKYENDQYIHLVRFLFTIIPFLTACLTSLTKRMPTLPLMIRKGWEETQ